MKFINIDFLYLLIPAVIFIAACFAVARTRRKRALEQLFGNASEKSIRLSTTRRLIRHIILFAAIVLAIFAGSRPYREEKIQTVSAQGRDIMVIFDVSKSMLCSDIAPTRLDHAKFLLQEIVNALPGDRFGLIAFAGNAYLSCPLTIDSEAFMSYVRDLSCDTIPVGGTDLEKAFNVALKSFRAASGSEHAIVLFTDGEELSGDSARLAAELKNAGIKLFIFGLGDPNGAPLVDENGLFRKDENGKVIVSKLNEAKLAGLAKNSDGFYFRSGVADTGVDEVVSRLRQQSKGEFDHRQTVAVEQFEYFLIPAAILLLLYVLISEVPGGVLLLILSLSLSFPATVEAGNEQASPDKKVPVTPVEIYNDALGKQKSEEKGFLENYENVLRDPEASGKLKAKALFNLGADRHCGAEKTLSAAEKSCETMDKLDAALQQVGAAEKLLDAAENFYAQSMSVVDPELSDELICQNLARLAADRSRAADLKKKIEELKEKIKEAQQAAQNAQKENQAGDKSEQQKQDSQADNSSKSTDKNNDSSGGKDSGKEQKNHSGEQNQKSPHSAGNEKSGGDNSQNALDKAISAAQDLEKAARDLNNRSAQEKAQAVQQELSQAKDAQEKQDRQTASEKIQSAQKLLAEFDQKDSGKNDSGKNDASSGAEKRETSGGSEKSGEKRENASVSGAAAEKSTEQGGDERQKAGMLLQMMENSEKDFRRQIKIQLPADGSTSPEKDW